ncbi:hypothetical protein INT47_011250 [Mucor saturninus]|uniref:Uncharacterized protein n=1 Tax=Mucor saturninus TaxID=64648 RepID=A0A8H7RL13_9FUNG|nr:hypothetical protein INT47_011250 [Mucor saturninus]
MMNKANSRRRELFDLEQRLQLQEQMHIEYLATKQPITVAYQPAMVKQNHSSIPSPIVMMTPQKKSKRDSILEKVYGFRNNSPPPFLPIRPSATRPPSFLPMQEKRSPPPYGDYGNSTPIDSKH